MNADAYHRLAEVLDTLPNGFPAADDGVEIRLLEKIFAPDEAELFCELKLTFETVNQIARRTGRSRRTLAEQLAVMKEKGQIFGIDMGRVQLYRMLPWVFGIYEFQVARMDTEMAELWETYARTFGKSFFAHKPQLMQVIPIESEIENAQAALPYERVSSIIENSQSLMYFDCICKKQKAALGQPCARSAQVCTAFAPVPGVFDNHPYGTPMTRTQAYALLNRAEAEGLVHMTWNVQSGHYFICNCCGCCCDILRAINDMGIDAREVVNSAFYARIDPEVCTACGVCADERCQVQAVEEGEAAYRVLPEKCIGCGLCVSACPADAISLIRKPEAQIETPPEDEMDWYDRRARGRGVDISRYK